MGVALKELIASKEIGYEQLQGKILAIDSYNTLYQFLTTIRGQDGTPLQDSKGNVTSHLAGLFSRTTNFMQRGIKPVFVFDGQMPALKQKEIEKRSRVKEDAEKRYKEAAEKEDTTEMRKFAARTTRLNHDMVMESKQLIDALGLPIIQAPAECDAQITHLVNKGDAFGAVSQDFDCLLHGCKLLIRNLSVAGKRKKAGKMAFETVSPESIDLRENLDMLGLTQDQLIALGMLVGTDYNNGGIKGIGPKNALKLVKQYPNPETLFKEVKWGQYFDYGWEEVFKLFKNMKITDDYEISWRPIKKERIVEILVEEHNFSRTRIEDSLSKIEDGQEKGKQKGLGEFF
jgi:flap endonuclease-1